MPPNGTVPLRLAAKCFSWTYFKLKSLPRLYKHFDISFDIEINLDRPRMYQYSQEFLINSYLIYKTVGVMLEYRSLIWDFKYIAKMYKLVSTIKRLRLSNLLKILTVNLYWTNCNYYNFVTLLYIFWLMIGVFYFKKYCWFILTNFNLNTFFSSPLLYWPPFWLWL